MRGSAPDARDVGAWENMRTRRLARVVHPDARAARPAPMRSMDTSNSPRAASILSSSIDTDASIRALDIHSLAYAAS